MEVRCGRHARWASVLGCARLGVLALACSCGAEPEPERVADQPSMSDVDWEDVTHEAASMLQAYLRIDTSNPPGHEARAAAWMAEVLSREGIEHELVEVAPGRANLVARLPATASPHEGALCLMSHLDVATADSDRWTHPPFGGVRDDQGMIWGRGALDMKGVGVAQLMTLLTIHRAEMPLTRDLVLLGVADEEVGSSGVQHLLATRGDELGCAYVLNEGGMGIVGGLVDGLTTFAVSYAEKGATWVRMVATGPPGHGSTPLPDTAPARLQAALRALARRPDVPRLSPELYELLGAVGQRAGGLRGAVLSRPWAVDLLAMGELLGDPLARAIMTDTINVTGFGGAKEPNVVPGEVWAQLDIRTLPGTTLDDVLAELNALVDDPMVRFEVISSHEAQVSSVDDPVFRTLMRETQRAYPRAAVGPLLMMGSTDSAYFRERGVAAYGLALFPATPEELRGMHGVDERISVQALGRGTEILVRSVVSLQRQWARKP